jgi:D-glycero-D-manno-heptose 1,7-bisphosphate phosphatase
MSSFTTVFLDRDGVINVNRPDHVKCWDEFEFLPRALPALAMLTKRGFAIVVVTNQAVVNRGLVSLATLGELHSRMCAAIHQHGGRVQAVLYCPHRPEEGCPCRKPQPGLLFRAAQELGVDLAAAIVVGDHATDLEAARRAGCRSLLVTSGRGIEGPHDGLPAGCVGVAPDLMAAAECIVADYASGPAPRDHRRPSVASEPTPRRGSTLEVAVV